MKITKLTHDYHKVDQSLNSSINIKENDNYFIDPYIRPDLNDDVSDLEEYINYNSLNKQQIKNLRTILNDNTNDISISQKNQLISILLKSFDNVDYDKNWRILWILVNLLKNKKTFYSCYNPVVSDIAVHFLSKTDLKCFVQSLYLLKIIIKRTNFRINTEKASFLLSLLSDDSFDSEYKSIIMKIISKHLDINISDEMIQNIYQVTYLLLKCQSQMTENQDFSIQSMSLRLIKQIIQRNQLSLSDDVLSFFYFFANSKRPTISMDGVNVFISYVQNPTNFDQIIQFRLVEKLLQLNLFQVPNVYKLVLDFMSIISSQNEIGAKTVYMNLIISNYYSSPFSAQKSIMNIIYNLIKYKIITSLSQIADSYDFVISFLDCDDEELLIVILQIFLFLQSDILNHLQIDTINTLESLSNHSNEQISVNSRLILEKINELSK